MERTMEDHFKEWEENFSPQYAIYHDKFMTYYADPSKRVIDADEYARKLNLLDRVNFYEGYINNLNYCLKKHTILPLRSMKEKILDLENYLPVLSAKKKPLPKDFDKYIYYFLQREDFYSVWNSKETDKKQAEAISHIKSEIHLLKKEIIENENIIKEAPIEIEIAEERLSILRKKVLTGKPQEIPAHPFKNDEIYFIFLYLIEKEIKKDKARFTYIFNFLTNGINNELERTAYFLFIEGEIDSSVKSHRLQQNANNPRRISKIEYNYGEYVKKSNA